jgi:hypothetical protein
MEDAEVTSILDSINSSLDGDNISLSENLIALWSRFRSDLTAEIKMGILCTFSKVLVFQQHYLCPPDFILML